MKYFLVIYMFVTFVSILCKMELAFCQSQCTLPIYDIAKFYDRTNNGTF